METIGQLIDKAVQNRKSKIKEYENMLHDITKWTEYSHYINDTFVDNESWKSLISKNNQQKNWNKVLDIIKDSVDDEGKKIKGILSLLEELGDGETPGLFTTAYSRMNRPHVNIGVVGAYRQGKSTLLKQLIQPSSESVTSEALFPTNIGAVPCTGVPINYINDEYQEGNPNPTAIVNYHSVKSFSNNINKYLEECHLKWKPIEINDRLTKDDLKKYCEKNKQEAEKIQDAQSNTLQGTLKNIILYYKSYIDLIGKDSVKIDLSTSSGMEKYYDSVTYCFGNRRANYAVYAAEEVNVYVKFKVDGKEVGNIQFLDTPGVGENRVGIDETLKNKLQNDIDTVIAIESAHTEAVDPKALNSFHTSLKNNYGGKQSNFIYYIINDKTSSDEVLVSEAFRRAFKEGIETIPNPIILNKDHKLVIDCKYNKVYDYQITDKGELNELELRKDDNCQKVLFSFIENLARNINSIDDEFNKKAVNLFNLIKTKMDELKRLTINVQIDGGRSFSAVRQTMKALNGELAALKINAITNDIQYDIKQYANEEGCGKSVLDAVVVYFDKFKDTKVFEKEQEKKIIDAMASIKEYNAKIERFKVLGFELLGKDGPCTSNEYRAWREFEVYCRIKIELFNIIVDNINGKIKLAPVLNRLKEAQRSVYEVLRQPRFLGFVCDDSKSNEEWYSALIDMVNDDELRNVFSGFFQFDVESRIAKFIEDNIINSTIRPFMHRDDFDGSSFRDIEKANHSILGSLFAIEHTIKKALCDEEDSVIKKLKEVIEAKFEAEKTNITDMVNKYEQLADFVDRNYDKILLCSGSDENILKQSLIKQWRDTVFK